MPFSPSTPGIMHRETGGGRLRPPIQEPLTSGPKLLSLVMGCWLGLNLVGCTGDPSLIRMLTDDPHRAIALEITYRDGAPEYTHPALIPPEKVFQALTHINANPASLLSRLTGGSSIQQPAFTENQALFIANHISRALAQATPLETATFFWADSRGNGIWEVTSGGLFIQHEALHLNLVNYRQTLPGQTFSPKWKQQPLIPIGEPLHTLQATSPVRTVSSESMFFGTYTPHFVIPLSSPMPQIPEKHDRRPTQLPDSEVIKQRLQLLEDLRKDGFLTEEEYGGKRKEILDGL